MTKSIPYKDIQASYFIGGKGSTLVLIHGFCEDMSMWDHVKNSLVKNFQVILIDLPGYGNSTPTNEKLSIVWMAEMVNKILVNENISCCTMMGHSLGAYVTIHFAELYKEKLNGIGFINSHVYADDIEKKLNRDKSAQFIEKHSAKLFIRELFNNLFSEVYKKNNPDLIKHLITHAQNTLSDKTIIDTLIAMRDRENKAAILKKLNIPVLFIIGKNDETIPLHVSLSQTYIASVNQVHIRDHIAHMSIFEDTEYSLNAIIEFVNFCNNK